MGVAIKADVTVSFIASKRGLFTADGPDYAGHIIFNGLGLPDNISSQLRACHYLLPDQKITLPLRTGNSHKGMFGHLMLVGGSTGMEGAARLAGEAAMRCGSGLITIATGSDQREIISGQIPEIMALTRPAHLLQLVEQADVLAIGPGLGKGEWAEAILSRLLQSNKPMLVDADALNYLAHHPSQNTNWILTPHPGEAARLLGISIQDVQSDRFAAVHAIQKKYAGVVVLKGQGTLVCDGKLTNVCATGHSGMASAGMGDVLSGILASLLGQFPSMSLFDIACSGVLVHGRAGMRAGAAGQRGMLASDLILHLREVVNGY